MEYEHTYKIKLNNQIETCGGCPCYIHDRDDDEDICRLLNIYVNPDEKDDACPFVLVYCEEKK